MNSTSNLKTKKNQVRYLMQTVKNSHKQGNLLLVLYWKIFDGIDIPPDVMRAIAERGTSPECVGRLVRFVEADIKAERSNDLERSTTDEQQSK